MNIGKKQRTSENLGARSDRERKIAALARCCSTTFGADDALRPGSLMNKQPRQFSDSFCMFFGGSFSRNKSPPKKKQPRPNPKVLPPRIQQMLCRLRRCSHPTNRQNKFKGLHRSTRAKAEGVAEVQEGEEEEEKQAFAWHPQSIRLIRSREQHKMLTVQQTPSPVAA